MSIALSIIKYPTKIPGKVQHIYHKYKPNPKRRSLATRIEILRKRNLVIKARRLIEMTTPDPESFQDDTIDPKSFQDDTIDPKSFQDDTIDPESMHSEPTDLVISLEDLTHILENDNEIIPGKTVHPILLQAKLDASKVLYDFAETDSDDYTTTDSEEDIDIPSSTNLLPSHRENRTNSIDSLVSEEAELVDI
jgi:hypothetical protein